jgi:adenine phosphoribosyltransferase
VVVHISTAQPRRRTAVASLRASSSAPPVTCGADRGTTMRSVVVGDMRAILAALSEFAGGADSGVGYTGPSMISSDTLSAELRSLIRDVPDFPRPGIVFRDISKLLGDARAFREAVEAIAGRYRDENVDLVAGIESRGFIIGGAVARSLNAGFVPVRKAGRLPGATVSAAYSLEYGEAIIEIHADAVTPGQRVLVVDDLLATGGTAVATASLVERLKGRIVGIAFLVELLGLGGAAMLGDRPYTALVRI